MSEKDYYCANCCNLDVNNTSWFSSGYYCKEKCKYVEQTDRACNSFRMNKDTIDEYNSKNSYKQSGCFITTIVCEILKKKDNELDRIRELRKYLAKQAKEGIQDSLDLLTMYDSVGPKLANYITSQEDKVNYCQGLWDFFLEPCMNDIDNNDFEEAKKKYINLIYSINGCLENEELETDSWKNTTYSGDIDKLGHGVKH